MHPGTIKINSPSIFILWTYSNYSINYEAHYSNRVFYSHYIHVTIYRLVFEWFIWINSHKTKLLTIKTLIIIGCDFHHCNNINMTDPWGSSDPTLRTTVLNDLINKTLAFLNTVHNPLSLNQPLTSVTEARSNESNQFLKAIRVFPQLSYFWMLCHLHSRFSMLGWVWKLFSNPDAIQNSNLPAAAWGSKEWAGSRIMWLVHPVILFPVSQWWVSWEEI